MSAEARTAVPFTDFRAHLGPLRVELDAAIARVLDSGWFILGPENEAFERELAVAFGAREAVAVANGTEAIQLGLEAIGVGPGDDVVTSSLSAAFTALAIERAGARPVFADVDAATLNVTAETLEHALTPRTRALVPVHLYGQPADMDAILDLARRRGLLVLEDACQAHGATWRGRTAGTPSGLGALSFYPTKNLGALGDGGALLVEDPETATRLRRLRNGGQRDRYHHELRGMNSRLDEMQAAILRVKLRHLPRWNARRRGLAALYDRELGGLPLGLPVEASGARGVHHLYVVRHPERERVTAGLRERGVATLVHYPIPLHLQAAFTRHGGKPG
ncbi:MAG TPA: DegT/DnrJ/EryC1/StrS family aminotransferase, partial [Vicinamibacteria bacterium]|nr:DegT/DnrJ/EryC1/StrS family aminotransferase [Vicinamibacteria bacterium]